MIATTYKFDPAEAYTKIKEHIEAWAKKTNTTKFILGISGGKDSTVVAMLLTAIFGKDAVYGVMLPCGEQSDIQDSKDVINCLGIHSITVNIGDAFNSIVKQIPDASYDTKTNLPARLRMSTIFAVGQTINAKMINTCNLSEDMVGYATLFGDCAGCYAPIQGLTVTEVRELGVWLLNNHIGDNERLKELIFKTPIDGLQPLSDEEKLGFTYKQLDKLIRENIYEGDFKEKIQRIFYKNKFKLEIVQMEQPDFDALNYPNHVKYDY